MIGTSYQPRMAELTPRDDHRKRVSEILKRVDQLLKTKEYEQAFQETERAKELDPRNVYVHAYQERIAFLIEERKREQELEERRRREQEETRKRFEEERRKIEAERLERIRLEEERRRQQDEARKQQEELRREEEQLRIEDQRRRDAERREREALLRAEADYREDRQTGNRTEPPRDHASPRRQPAATPRILVIDDDVKLLNVIADTLADAGFDVKAVPTSDEAYRLLREFTPDLILSDINLETSTMGGFTFYEKVRELEHLVDIPFIFLSGLTDEVLIRTGKELGVDDYITKPFSDETLIAVIKGKIKRYRQMKARKAKY